MNLNILEPFPLDPKFLTRFSTKPLAQSMKFRAIFEHLHDDNDVGERK